MSHSQPRRAAWPASTQPALAALITERARSRGCAVFLQDVSGAQTVSFAQVETATAGLGADLAARGTPSGAAVLLVVEDPVTLAVAQLGVIAAGYRAVPVDPGAPAQDIARTMRATEPAVLLSDRAELIETATLPARHVDLDSLLAGHPGVEGRRAPARPGGVLLHTSGSTGDPKTVLLDEAKLLHVARSVATHNELTEADRGYNCLPLFHINAEVVGVLASLVAGATLVLAGRFRRTGFWADLERLGITWLNAVPAILAILSGEAGPDSTRLRFVRSASAPLLPHTRTRIETMLGVPIVESYGMTEAASQITATPLDGSAPAGSAGRPVGVELQVRAPDGTVLPDNEVGMVWIRGAGVITSYVGGRAADRFDTDNWLETGDLGRLEDGFLFLAGRSDDVINRGGEMVYPREIEEILLADPRVREAVVVGLPDDILGAKPVGYLVVHPGAEDLDGLIGDLEQRCIAELSRFKRPASLHIVDGLPRAATGKILRHRVRADGLKAVVGE